MQNLYENYAKKPKVQVIKGDFIDRLHGRTSISFLFVILILIVFKQAIYSNILCWYPTALNDAQGQYLSQFCYINSTYLFPDEYDSENYATYHHDQVQIPYYQYIIFIIIGQILLFYIPSLMWEIIASNSTGYMNKLLDISSATINKIDISDEFLKVLKSYKKKSRSVEESDTKKLESINEESNDYVKKESIQKRPSSQNLESLNSNDSNLKNNKSFNIRFKQKLVLDLNPLSGMKYLTLKYFLLKILNLSNSIGQLFILNKIFGGQFLDYGFKYAIKLWNSENPLLITKEFPIYTLCDFFVHQPNRKIHENTVQCILTVNVLLEKFYVLIWFWLIVLSIITLWNLFSWGYEIVFSTRARFIHKYLTIHSKMTASSISIKNNDSDDSENKNFISNQSSVSEFEDIDIERFQKKYLGVDGLVMLLIIKSVAGDVAFIKLLGDLFNDFRNDLETKTV